MSKQDTARTKEIDELQEDIRKAIEKIDVLFLPKKKAESSKETDA